MKKRKKFYKLKLLFGSNFYSICFYTKAELLSSFHFSFYNKDNKEREG